MGFFSSKKDKPVKKQKLEHGKHAAQDQEKKRDSGSSRENLDKEPRKSTRPHRMEKNPSEADILSTQRNKQLKTSIERELRSKEEKLAQLTCELVNANNEAEKLRDEKEKISKSFKKLSDEVKEQELLVRLERGDYEELKTKETEFVKIKDENQLLKTKIKKLQNSALESVSDKSNLDATNREIESLKQASEKLKTNLERQVEEVTRFNNQLSQENKQLEDRNYDLIAENKLIQAELKNSLKQQNDLEKKLKNQQASEEKIKSEKDDQIKKLTENLTQLEDKIRSSKMSGQDQDITLREKNENIKSLKSKIELLEQNEKNKDDIIQEKEQKIQNLKYKIKDTQETYESQWEEMMMMTERQLKAVRAEKSDTSAIKKLQSDVKVLENKLQNKKDENSTLSREISDLKRKLTRLENDAKGAVSISKFEESRKELTNRLEEAEDVLKEEKLSRMDEKLQLERKIKNLQGHMINIYTGNIPPEMAQMLDTIVKIKLQSAHASNSGGDAHAVNHNVEQTI